MPNNEEVIWSDEDIYKFQCFHTAMYCISCKIIDLINKYGEV